MTVAIKEADLNAYLMPGCFGADIEEAYVRFCEEEGEMLWAIFDGAGEKIGHASSREMAMAVARQNDLTPFNVQ